MRKPNVNNITREINIYIDEICNVLNIKKTKVRIYSSAKEAKFSTSTQMASCSSDGEELKIVKPQIINTDFIFCLGHELRHLWQIETDRDTYFKNYQPLTPLMTKDYYNRQLAEIDANAFGTITMMHYFNLMPTFPGLSEDLKAIIFKRAKEIEQKHII
jgi:hypothetical protein